ncbi:MAG: hypothetical protein M3Y54_01315 [Bacteroidota bacterium]|nr:hypothetical protein [Bacteroidota bacterium]
MSANPIENNPTPKATGNLEELFRHHLGEEAAVPPRPMLWEQIDNSLLLRQNEQYRRRLAATRWVAAASLLLATLAGTGWWAGRTGLMGGPGMAATTRPVIERNTATNPAGPATATDAARATAAGAPNGADLAANTIQPAGATATERAVRVSPATNAGTAAHYGVAVASSAAGTTAAQRFGTAFATSVGADQLARSGRNQVARNAMATQITKVNSGVLETAAMPESGALAATRPAPAAGLAAAEGAAGASLSGLASASGSAAVATGSAAGAAATLPTLAMATPAATVAEETAALAAHPATLSLAEVPALPGTLTAGAEPVELAATPHRWQYGATYTAGTFNPNVNFSRAGIEPAYGYNPVLGPAELSEAAAAEYRQHLHAGLSQRVALVASRHLRGHWSLSTGVEMSKANARSATTVSFVGEQVADGGQKVGQGTLRTTDFSYTMAGLPLELRYANPAKHGWSLYGRLGGVVSALLSSRSEVAGRPEATQTYSITSASTPYRHLTSSVRGAAGARFSPGVGHWAVTLGPVAEVGLVSLNAHPVQSYFAQSHPYSLGLEAGLEFGR